MLHSSCRRRIGLDGDAGAPSSIRVDTKPDVRTDCCAYGLDPSISPSGSMPTFTFSAVKPFDMAQSASSAARSGSAPETDILIGHSVPNRPAEQPIDRQARGFAQNVPERDLDSGLRKRMTGYGAAHLRASAARCRADLRPSSAGSRKLRIT